jgi:hypothetical protein
MTTSRTLEQQIAAEYDYLRLLIKTGREAEAGYRIGVLRDHGWEIRSTAQALGVSRQGMYYLMDSAARKEITAPADSPPVLDLRPPPVSLVMRSDAADVPPPLCKPLRAMWAHVFRDKSAGRSDLSAALDVLLHLLLRRGVPNIRIGDCGNVTHRAVSERMRRAVSRGTLPSEAGSSFLPHPAEDLPAARIMSQALHPARMSAVVQVVSASFPRFYTAQYGNAPERDRSRLFMFDPSKPVPASVSDIGLDESTRVDVTSEEQWVDVIADADPNESPLYVVPVQWLYVFSVFDARVFAPQNFDLIPGVYPQALRPPGNLMKFFTKTDGMLRQARPIAWSGSKGMGNDDA